MKKRTAESRPTVPRKHDKDKQYTTHLQDFDLVYKLSEIGQALEKNDLSTAGSVLGGSTNTEWVQRANIAFNKVSLVP
ncbi:hypothetical protein RJT34_03886 [Clitoria ternatea]|uniref:Maintenance of Photosystem II under High light 2 C-terminal domain-containing protein n=1 Tax=Clitoria ternatea TaxID=43366 RepID=A0AAN9KN20_CLITE